MEDMEDLTVFEQNKQDYINDRDYWASELDKQNRKYQTVVDEIERDKIVQIDNLRKEMLLQIRAVKIKMLNMNEHQLVRTTKLTVVQNAQLTGELEYQSKQTEHLMYKNHQMKGIIHTLRKDLVDHKEVEKELAKRSHFCQKVIKKYKQ